MKTINQYPAWICHECGTKYGKRVCGVATWHTDICGICRKGVACTEPRDYGYLDEAKISIIEHKI